MEAETWFPIVRSRFRKEENPQPKSSAMYMNGGNYRTSSIYQKVNELSTDDLEEWRSDDMKIKDFVESLPHVRAKQEIAKEMYAANEALAKVSSEAEFLEILISSPVPVTTISFNFLLRSKRSNFLAIDCHRVSS